jgi:2-hydroxy-6-oxonona-2,4-dienedioate hydrolase
MVNDINLHYWQVGDGPNIVMLHGLTGNLAVWHFTAIPKLRHTYRITTYDLRGHGRSDMPATGYTTQHMAEDLKGLMDALEIERAMLVGHSLGADISLHTALLYPERVEKIVAIEAGTAALVHLRLDKNWPGWESWAKAMEEYGGIKVPREKWHDIDYMLRKSLEVPIVFGPARGLPRKGEKLLKLLDTTTMVEEYQDTAGMTLETIATIQQPVLLVYGEKSTYLGTYDALKETLPNCRPVLLEGCEHFGPLEKPDVLMEHVGPFLKNGL